MLTILKSYLKLMLVPVLYVAGFGTMIASISKNARWGYFLLIFLIPQPNIWHKLLSYPFGKDFLDLLYVSIFIGIVIQRKWFFKTENSSLICAYIMFNYLTLWNSSFRFSLPLPITHKSDLLAEWKNYAEMVFLYFLTISNIEEEDQQKTLVIVIGLVVLFIAIRSYRDFSGGISFSYDKRYGGPFESVELGANHFGAFIGYVWSFFIGLLLYDDNKKRKYLYLSTILFSVHPIFFAYSRGVYIGCFAVLCLYGIAKNKRLLILPIALLILWQVVLPKSVVDRILMTESPSGVLESSAAERLSLWKYAIDVYERNPIFGVGFDGYRIIRTRSGMVLTDTHNYYLKVLCEQGIVGMVFFMVIIFRAITSGIKLLRRGKSPFQKGLGLGFIGCLISLIISNAFGDRFSYFVLGSYFWIFWGLVDRSIIVATRDLKATDR